MITLRLLLLQKRLKQDFRFSLSPKKTLHSFPSFSFSSGPPGSSILDQGAGDRKGEEEGAKGVPDEEAEVQLHNQHTLLHQSQPETEIGPKTSTNPSPKLTKLKYIFHEMCVFASLFCQENCKSVCDPFRRQVI